MPDTKRVYIVDDDLAVRRSLLWLLESAGFTCHAFDSAEAFLEAYEDHNPGCLLLDVRLPGVSGLELLDQLGAGSPRLPVIILTGHADVPMAVRAMRSGAIDFLEKPFSDEQLLERIEAAVNLGCRNHRDGRRAEQIRQRIAQLTERERQVMDRIVRGRSNKEIADDLSISPKTVEVHRGRVMRKMDATNAADLVRMVIMLEPDS